MDKTPLLILNFHPEPLSSELVAEIETEIGRPVEQRMINFSINTAKLTYPQTLSILDKINIKNLPTNVVLHLPGLPTGAVYLVIDFFARTGQFPTVLELVRDWKDRKSWRVGQFRDLNVEVNATRNNPKRVIWTANDANETDGEPEEKSSS